MKIHIETNVQDDDFNTSICFMEVGNDRKRYWEQFYEKYVKISDQCTSTVRIDETDDPTTVRKQVKEQDVRLDELTTVLRLLRRKNFYMRRGFVTVMRRRKKSKMKQISQLTDLCLITVLLMKAILGSIRNILAMILPCLPLANGQTVSLISCSLLA